LLTLTVGGTQLLVTNANCGLQEVDIQALTVVDSTA
jgi:hypothetical protein